MDGSASRATVSGTELEGSLNVLSARQSRLSDLVHITSVASLSVSSAVSQGRLRELRGDVVIASPPRGAEPIRVQTLFSLR